MKMRSVSAFVTILCRYSRSLVCAVALFILPGAMQAAHYYAAQNGQAPGDYTSWDTAASNIQDAVNAAASNDTVWVGAGRYTLPPNATNYMGPNVVYIDKPLILRSSNGVPASTIVDGSGANRGIAAVYSTPSGTNRIVIAGLTICNCYATNTGGGIFFEPFDTALNGVVQDCVISDNTVAWGIVSGSWPQAPTPTGSRGGGIGSYSPIYINGGFKLTMSNCVVRGNRALRLDMSHTSEGGGIYVRSDGLKRITRCLIESNSATVGGGVCLSNPNKTANTLEYCVISDNKAVGDYNMTVSGAGLFLGVGNHLLRNCLVNNNASDCVGGGIAVYVGIAEMNNCTVASNKAAITTWGGAGITMRFASQGAGLRIVNSIIYSNVDGNINANANLYLDSATNCFFTNTCTFYTNAIMLGSDNITNPPAFANVAGRNFRLTHISPCLNAGTNQSWMTNGVDLDGLPRISPKIGGTVDMGAYEFPIQSGSVFSVK